MAKGADSPDLDIDFENFSVDTERAGGIRGLISGLKASGWIDSWKLLLHERGRDETPTGENSPKLPGISADSLTRVFRIEDPAHPALGFAIAQQGTELKVFHNDTVLVELAALPKEDDYAVYYINGDRFLDLTDLMNGLDSDLKAAKAQKHGRGNVWKERFSKS